MEFDINRFRETFFQEASEHLGEMESGLLQLEGHPNPELLNAIFRGAHSIKGAIGTFGFEDVARFTHAMEGLLDRMRAGDVPPSAERIIRHAQGGHRDGWSRGDSAARPRRRRQSARRGGVSYQLPPPHLRSPMDPGLGRYIALCRSRASRAPCPP